MNSTLRLACGSHVTNTRFEVKRNFPCYRGKPRQSPNPKPWKLCGSSTISGDMHLQAVFTGWFPLSAALPSPAAWPVLSSLGYKPPVCLCDFITALIHETVSTAIPTARAIARSRGPQTRCPRERGEVTVSPCCWCAWTQCEWQAVRNNFKSRSVKYERNRTLFACFMVNLPSFFLR